MSITLTEKAAKHIRRFIDKQENCIGVRLGIEYSGCSGMSHKLEYVEKPKADDVAFESLGIRIFVESHNLPFLSGTQLDLVREGLSEKFQFNNPNVRHTCTCGNSFQI